jgi:hypothetical protein
MNKFLLVALFFSTGLTAVFSQNCTPDPNNPVNPGVYPDSATGFVQGYANQAYLQLITIKVPQDTQPITWLPPIAWDSTVLGNITGLPNGFTYACWNNGTSPNRCSWRGNTKGCVVITGTPTINDTGTYNLTIPTFNYLGGSSTANNYVITYYKIKINAPSSIPDSDKDKFTVAQNQPNPFKGNTLIEFNSPDPDEVTIKVYNLVGSMVFTRQIKAKQGINKFNFDGQQLNEGIYIYTISNGEQNITKRMVINR